MLQRAFVIALTLTTAGQSSWQRTDSTHFEIHYLPPLASETRTKVLKRRARHDRISGG